MLLWLSFISLLSGTVAFTGVTKIAMSSTSQLAAKSKALPFMECPPKLDGTQVGDYGFDPLGLTYTLETLHFVKSAELKHGRVAMLASVGFLVQQKLHILTSEADPLRAVEAVGLGPNLQILSFIGVIELMTWDRAYNEDYPAGTVQLSNYSTFASNYVHDPCVVTQAIWVSIR